MVVVVIVVVVVVDVLDQFLLGPSNVVHRDGATEFPQDPMVHVRCPMVRKIVTAQLDLLSGSSSRNGTAIHRPLIFTIHFRNVKLGVPQVIRQ